METKRELTAIESALAADVARLNKRVAELEAACEAALTLLTDPDADGFRANEIEAELRAALKGAK